MIIICIFIIFTFSYAPIYVVNKLGPKFSPIRNTTIIGLIYGIDRDQVEHFTFSVNNVIIPVGAFLVILLCTIILAVQLQRNMKWRNTTHSQAQSEKLSGRNQRVAKMVVFISILFIACFLPNTISLFVVACVPSLFINGKHVKITQLLFGVTYIIESINCSMNICIYYNMSSRYRDTFRMLFVKLIH